MHGCVRACVRAYSCDSDCVRMCTCLLASFVHECLNVRTFIAFLDHGMYFVFAGIQVSYYFQVRRKIITFAGRSPPEINNLHLPAVTLITDAL